MRAGCLWAIGAALFCIPLAASANDFATDFHSKSDASVVNAPHSEKLVIRKIFLFPGSDDTGNVLAPDFDAAIAKKLEKNSRFQVIKNQKVADALRGEDKGYGRIVVSPEVHSKTARLVGADTTVVLEARHVGQELRLKEDWRRADGSLLFSETRAVAAKSSMQEQQKMVSDITDTIIGRIPFKGSVTGRTGNTLTLDLNQDQVAIGDKLSIARVLSTKEHPFLKTLINIDYVNVGTAEVTSVDNVLAFANITDESSGEEIAVDNKIIRVDSANGPRPRKYKKITPVSPVVEGNDDKDWNSIEKYEKSNKDPLEEQQPPEQQKLSGSFEKAKARYGMVGASINFGNLSHSEGVSGTSTDISALGFGANFMGELWVTKNWIVGLTYDFMSATLKGTNAGNNITETGTNWNKFDFYGAYRYLTEGTVEGTYINFGLGYESEHMSLPYDPTNAIGKKAYSGVLLLVQGNIAVDEKNRVEVGLGLQPFSSLTETDYTNGDTDGANVVDVSGKWLYQWKPNLYFSVGLDYDVASGTLKNGKNLTDKRFSISPGLRYLF